MKAFLPTLVLLSCCACQAGTGGSPEARQLPLASLAPASSPQPRAEISAPVLVALPKSSARRRIERAIGRDRGADRAARSVLPAEFLDVERVEQIVQAVAQESAQERWSLDFGMGLEDEVPINDEVRSELESGFSDLVLSVSWTFGLSQMTAIKGQLAAARVQDVNFDEAFDDAELAWLAFGVEFGF
jgi:hypothetical protein